MTIKYNTKQGKVHQILCTSCKRKTRHLVLTSVDAGGSEDWGGGDFFHWSSSHQIVQCQGCETISVRIESANSEDFDMQEGPTVHEEVYPRRTSSTIDPKNLMNVPYNLRRIYRETVDSFNNDILTLCGAGVRTLVEGICTDKNIKGGAVEPKPTGAGKPKLRSNSLEGKINGLAENGILTENNAKVLHQHRYLGNEAVHELNAPSKEELALAIEIMENVLISIYEIPKKGLELQSKRSKPRRPRRLSQKA
jgi:hypothetical protein